MLVETTSKQGVDSALAQHPRLRERALISGRYNFSGTTLLEPPVRLPGCIASAVTRSGPASTTRGRWRSSRIIARRSIGSKR